MGSWSSLANMSTPTSGQARKKNAAMESFEQFRKAAKEKEERVCIRDNQFVLQKDQYQVKRMFYERHT